MNCKAKCKIAYRDIFSNPRLTWVIFSTRGSKTHLLLGLITTFCGELIFPQTPSHPRCNVTFCEKPKNFRFFSEISLFYEKNTSKMCFRSWMLSFITPRSFSRLFWPIIYLFNAFQKFKIFFCATLELLLAKPLRPE